MKSLESNMHTRLAIVILIFMYPVSLFGQELVDDSFPDMNIFWKALADKNWPIVIGIGLMLLVWVIRKNFFDVVPKKYLPIFMLVIPMISGIATRMMQYVGDGQPWWQGMIQGMFEGAMIGFTAMGAWDVKKSSERKVTMKQHNQFFK